MSHKSRWQLSLQSFFDFRAMSITKKKLDRAALCFVSGKDPRLWIEDSMYDDLIISITSALRLNSNDSLLEIGCAAGLLTVGLTQHCLTYTGIDLSKRALAIAQSLRLSNTTFNQADATELPFIENSFDKILCYDVFNNFPDFEFGAKVIDEALRVVKPGGYVCIGALPDLVKRDADSAAWRQMQAEMSEKYGPQERYWPKENWRQKLFTKFMQWKGVTPQIVCYYFNRDDFQNYGVKHGLETEILPLHALSPYKDTRFSVIYKKPA